MPFITIKTTRKLLRCSYCGGNKFYPSELQEGTGFLNIVFCSYCGISTFYTMDGRYVADPMAESLQRTDDWDNGTEWERRAFLLGKII